MRGHFAVDAFEEITKPRIKTVAWMREIGALSPSVIGGPLTMTFIALETTGNLSLTAAVFIAVIVSAQVTHEVSGSS
jgi:H+/Cl- antiporter ClcA